MRTFIKMLLMLIVSAFLGTALMILVYMLPVDGMKRNVRSSIDMLMKEGVRNSWAAFSYKRPPRQMNAAKDVSQSMTTARPYSIIDGFTDGAMINTAIYNSGNVSSLVYDAMMNPYLSYKSSSDFGNPIETLSKALDADISNEEAGISIYPRYWHGFLVYLKPLLTFFGIPGIRVINFILQFILMVTVMLRISDKLGRAYAIAFALSVLVIDPIASAVCLTYSNVYYVLLITMLVMLSMNDSLKQGNGYCFVFMFTGILTAFLDLLTYPFASLGMPAVLYLLMNSEIKLSEKFVNLVKQGLSWGFGYFGMWASKWYIAYMFTGYDVISDGMNAAFFRMGTNIKGMDITFRWILSYIISMKGFLPFMLLLCAVIILLVIAMYISVRKGNTSVSDIIPLCFVSLYPFVWYAVLKQHSIIHYFFTYKVLCIFVFAWACTVIKCFGYKHDG